jgi:hypothetical protein
LQRNARLSSGIGQTAREASAERGQIAIELGREAIETPDAAVIAGGLPDSVPAW